jgi:curved DNA-binding protein CbpA
MQEFEEDFYAILGVDEAATSEEIRKAYLTLAKKLHPDRFPNDAEKRAVAQSEFAKVTHAHEIVSDSTRRAEYDTLRELSKRRDLSSSSETVPSVPGSDSEIALSEAPKSQAQTVREDENINIKWANKHLNRADDLFRKREYREAEVAMKEAIRLVPQEPKYRNKLAEIYLARGWKTLAMTEVQAALRLNPKDQDAKNIEARLKALSRTASQQVKVKNGFLERVKKFFSAKKR